MEYIALYPETLALVKRYPEAQRCRLYEAMANYAFTGEEPTWPEDALEWYGWEALKQQVDRAKSKAEQNKANGSKAKRAEAKASEPERTEANGSGSKRTEADLPKEKEKETDKDSNDDEDDCVASDSACARAFAAHIGRAPLPGEESNVSFFARTQHQTDDLVDMAVRIAAEHGAAAPGKYAEKLLREWALDGVHTLDDYYAREETS